MDDMSQGVTCSHQSVRTPESKMPSILKLILKLLTYIVVFQGDKEAMQTLLNKSAKLLATTVDENRRR